jgi:tryptophan-rich sensory protein
MDPFHSLALGGFMLPCFLAASTGAFFRPDAWYEALRKPRWNPPNWLFPPAWTVLYLCIGVAAWLVWRADGLVPAHLVWLVSLGFNAAWSVLFFGRKRVDWALWEVAGLWASILATILAFAPHSETAAWLLVPYLAWVSFAAALNGAIWRLNRGTETVRA